ncbi:PAS domain S-box protein [Pseudoalteromonas xiamenensis]|uniref:PAS domain S-box protein n=1 Tax=Pseudoalteromonas xiamenensis TaxID=882626 RepID=UPI001FCACBF1|nr:PAS domain S-box protein [Pseudoalteromonas xiamenensis]
MMETAVDGIVTIDSKGIIKSTNQAVERLLGWKEQELLGKNVSLLMPAPYKVEYDGYLERYLETGEARIIGKGREVDALHRNGEKVSIRLAIGHVKLTNDDFLSHLFQTFASAYQWSVRHFDPKLVVLFDEVLAEILEIKGRFVD